MNIDEYRALKAQEEEEKNSEKEGEKVDAQTQPTSTDEVKSSQEEGAKDTRTSEQETKPTENSKEGDEEEQVDETSNETIPTTIEIDGKQVTIDELKNGYMRQSDYTRKTQDLKREEQQYQQAVNVMEQIKANPEVASILSEQFDNPYLDPEKSKYVELEQKYYDMVLQNEIKELENKYDDFDVKEVLQIARDSGINDLDTAYHVSKSRKGSTETKSQESNVSIDDLKEQLRSELLSEIRAEQEANVDTSTVIQSGGDSAPISNSAPQLSQQEIKVAKMMGMNTDEYAKWRDVKNKK